jgi:tetratricopeptide (TPR) repeat protein
MMRLVALVNDGHTGLWPHGKLNAMNRWYPARLNRFEEGVFVISTLRTHKEILGGRVIRLNTIPAEKAWDLAQTVASGDNIFSRMASAPLFLMSPYILSGLGLTGDDMLEIEVEHPGGRRHTVRMPPVEVQSGAGWFFMGNRAPGDDVVSLPLTDENQWDMAYRHPDAMYWYHFDQGNGMLYARINAVLNSETPVYLNGESRAVTLEKFSQEILDRIDQGGVSRLAIDLRDNGGGNNGLAGVLAHGLAARPEINQRGRIFVITGRRTYSAAMNLTSMLESWTRAIFVGEPPGGAPSHYGDATGFTLPNSGMRVNVSTLHWDTGVRPWDIREIMEPDMPVAPRADRIREGRDPALEVIANYRPGDILADRMSEMYQVGQLDSALEYYMYRRKTGEPNLWSSDVLQLIEFGMNLIPIRGSGPDLLRVFEFATEQYPNNPLTWYMLGRMYAFPGRWKEAAEVYSRALELRPMNNTLRRMRQMTLRKIQP